MSTPAPALRTAGLAFALFVAACESPAPVAESDAPWSTKGRSVLPSDPSLAHLNTPAVTNLPQRGTAELRDAAMDLLIEATDSTNPLLRANALEAMHEAPERSGDPVRLALADPNRGVRFVAAMTVGKLRMVDLANLVDPLLDDPSDSVRAAAIFALRRCDAPVDPTPLARMVMSDDPEVKANAALVLGELGDASAIPILRSAARERTTRLAPIRARIIELQIAEAMVRLGSDTELAAIRAAVFSPPEQAELSVLATLMLGRLGDRTYMASLVERATRSGRDQEAPEIRMAAVQAVAQMDPTRAPRDVPSQYVRSERFEQRQQAAVTLGWFRDPAQLPTLAMLLEDQNPLVQVAAAGAILRSTRPVAASGETAGLVDTYRGGR